MRPVFTAAVIVGCIHSDPGLFGPTQFYFLSFPSHHLNSFKFLLISRNSFLCHKLYNLFLIFFSNESVPAFSVGGLPEPKVIDEISVSSSSSAANSPIQAKLMALETGTQLNVSSATVYSEAVPISTALSIENHSGYASKRLYNSQSTRKAISERKPKVPRIAAGEEIYMHHSSKEFSSQQTIMVDLTNGDSSEVECNGSWLATARNSNYKVDTVEVSRLPPFIGSDKFGSSTLARIARVVQEVCELCNAFVRSCRQHLIEKHGVCFMLKFEAC